MTALENAKYGFRPGERQSHAQEHASCVVVLREQKISAIAGELLVEVSNAVDLMTSACGQIDRRCPTARGGEAA